MEILTFNTGKLFTEDGQRIAAMRINNNVLMLDIDRQIRCLIRNCDLNQQMIMTRYDNNQYEIAPINFVVEIELLREQAEKI